VISRSSRTPTPIDDFALSRAYGKAIGLGRYRFDNAVKELIAAGRPIAVWLGNDCGTGLTDKPS
jgi:hypothetical protein